MKENTRLYNFVLILVFMLIAGNTVAQNNANLWQPFRITPRANQYQPGLKTQSVNGSINLSGAWNLSNADAQIHAISELKDTQDRFETTVPNSVQWSYYKAGKLPHPYLKKNSVHYQWILKKVWYYQKEVEIPASAKGQVLMLCFDGIDYFSRIWVNDSLIGGHEGIFGGPTIDISKIANYGGKNRIVVEVRAGNWGNVATDFETLSRDSEGRYDLSKVKGYDPKMSGKIIKPWALAGGPATEPFFSVGMWQGARIEILPKIHLERPFLTTVSTKGQKAQLHLSVEILAGTTSLQNRFHTWKETQIIISGDPKDNVHIPVAEKYSLLLEMLSGDSVCYTKKISLDLYQGRNWLEKDLTLPNPKLWNPVGMGEPNLYQVRVSLQKGGQAIDHLEFDFGIRTVEQIPSAGPRTADAWGNWQFVVNGRKLFVKGMNWVPADVLLDLTEERYRWTLEAAKNMGIQLIRIWGAGLLETDKFYEICNELGIMVWQDFPIGNQDTPDFPKDVWEAQIVQNIFRLRNNPSLVVWCGGNEFNPYSAGNSASIGILERNLNIFDKTRPFLRADPDNGSLHAYPDMDPCWYNRVYQFTPWITETGIPAMPEAALVKEVVDNKEFFDLGKKWDNNFYKSHPELTHHVMKRDPVSIGSVLKYASHFEDMSNPTIESATEASQVGAGEFYQILSEKMQANYPVTTGLMPWVFKRHWTFLIAHQMMDWFGQPGAQYYFLKRTYENTHVSLDLPRLLWAPMELIPLVTKITHANQNSLSGIVSVTVYNDRFEKLEYREKEVVVGEGPSVTSTEMGNFQLPSGYRNRFLLLVSELKSKTGEIISRSVYQPRSLEQMENQAFHDKFISEPVPWMMLEKGPWLKPVVAKTRTKLTAEVIGNESVFADRSKIVVKITNKGKVPAFLTKINIEGIKRAFFASDNYFWLNPGEVKLVTLEILWREEKSTQKISIVADAWNADKQSVSIK